jgi:hypothetical protein
MCCDQPIRVRPTPSKGKLFTRTGVRKMQQFSGIYIENLTDIFDSNLPSPGYCRRLGCQKKFFHCYEEDEVTVEGRDIILRKFYSVAESEAFSYSRLSAFSKELLDEVTNRVVLEHSQFINITKTYNRMDRNRGQGI